MFYKIDKNGNGIIDYNSFANCFTPRAYEYKILIESRGCFYGSLSDYKKYFEGPTRESIK